MAGHALMVGGRFDIQRGALGKISCVHHHVRFARSIWSALYVMRRSLFLAELFDRHHFKFSFGKTSEEVGKFGVHRVNILAIEIEDFFARVRVQFGVRL